MYPVLDKLPASALSPLEWIGGLAVLKLCTPANLLPLLACVVLDAGAATPQLVDLLKHGRRIHYPAVDKVARRFGYLCLPPADPIANIARCLDDESETFALREVDLPTLLREVFGWAWVAYILIVVLLCLVMVRLACSCRQCSQLTTSVQGPFIRRLLIAMFNCLTGLTRMRATVSQYERTLSQLEDGQIDQAAALVDLTIATGPIEEALLQSGIEVERLKQTNTDNGLKLQAAQASLKYL